MYPIVFVGAGPGDPELITVKGAKALEQADIVIYAGSLVNPKLLEYCSPQCKIYDSAELDLDRMVDIMTEGHFTGQRVVRLQTGDFSIYGSIREQIEELSRHDVPYELVAGVSSFLGAASRLSLEYTVPEISQSVIITRIAGRTPVPERESIRSFAAHQTSMCIFLSADRIEDVVAELCEGGYPSDTPAAVIYRATWEDEKIVRGTLEDIAHKTKEAKIRKHALILVGRSLGDEYNFSKLYDKHFTHGYRRAVAKE